MAAIGIVYFSGSGTTAGLAAAIKAGAKLDGNEVHMLPIVAEDISEGRWPNDAIAEQLTDIDLATGRHLGKRVAELAERLG